MAEPIKEVTLGGVVYNENHVKKSSVRTDANGKKTYSVFLKNGVKIEYPEQQKPGARLYGYELSFWDSLSNDTSTALYNFDGAKVTGTPDDDLIHMERCTNCKVDISGDDNDDEVIIDKNTVFWRSKGEQVNLSKGNDIIMDEHDNLTIYTDPKREGQRYARKEIDGPGTHRE